jgi:hypothetical protein
MSPQYHFVTPAKAGVHAESELRAGLSMDASLRWHDGGKGSAHV